MSLFGSLLPGSSNIKRFLFRRDAESAIYSSKPFPLPPLKPVKSIDIFRNSYPFPLGTIKIKELLLELEDYNTIINEAEKVLNNIFNLPYRDNINAGGEFKWNRDYISGYEWSNDISWKGSFFSFPEGTDIVNVWLPGRLNQLIFLGKGYLVTGDEKYVNEYTRIFNDFIEKNPFCTGVNWIEPEEVSARLLNIIFSIPLVLSSESLNEKFIDHMMHQVLLHSIFIENNLQDEDKGYGYFLNLASLAAAGIILKDTEYGKKLIQLSYSSAEEAVRKMISPEGVSTIRSVAFHPHIVEAFIIIRLSLQKAGIKFSKIFNERYEKMFDVLASLIREDNTVPIIGDNFIQRVLPFGREKNTFPLAFGCEEFNKGIYKSISPSPDSSLLFLKGAEALDQFNSIKPVKYSKISYGYPASGLFILRNNDIHITVDAADIGSGRKRTTGHNDTLSFELYFKGHPVIVDPGTYSLYSDASVRYQQRSVKNHNTLFIDDEEPVELEGVSSIKEDLTKTKVTRWHSDEREDILSVQHYAYARFSDPVVIKRIFHLKKDKNLLIIRDELFGGSNHKYGMSLILHPDVSFMKTDENQFITDIPAKAVISISSEANILCTILDTYYSPSYGKIIPAKKISSAVAAWFPLIVTTEIKLI
jgi:hypothetical protein